MTTSDPNRSESVRPEVVFARSGVDTRWDPDCESFLELAWENGLDPPWSCRAGGCNSCLHRLVEGEVEYTRELLLEPAEDEVLLCCSRPRTRVVIDA